MSAENFEFNSKLDGYFLDSIYENDFEHAQIVFEKFIESIPALLNELEESYAAGNVEFFRKRMHKIKPVLSFVGLTPLMQKAAVIEKSCPGVADLNTLSELYTGFKNELSEMIPVVENDLIKLKAIAA